MCILRSIYIYIYIYLYRYMCIYIYIHIYIYICISIICYPSCASATHLLFRATTRSAADPRTSKASATNPRSIARAALEIRGGDESSRFGGALWMAAVQIRTPGHVCACVHRCVRRCVRMCAHVCACVHVCMCACVHVCMRVRVFRMHKA